MGIDLNEDPLFETSYYIKRMLENKISMVPPELIYYKYIGESFKIGGVIQSPFRKDVKPSFGIYYNKNNILLFNDFGDTKYSGDVYKFIELYYNEVLNINTPKKRLKRFTQDFRNIRRLDIKQAAFQSKKALKTVKYKKSDFKLDIKIRDFNTLDITFWGTFGISTSTLKHFNVFPISHYFINDKGFVADEIAYAYIEYKDENYSIKIYQPFNKNLKWLANINFSIHQGYRQLPEKGELLIITKSLKDVMALYETLKISSIGIQGETSRIKPQVLKEYKERFKNVFTLFDNDSAGLKLANYYEVNYNLPSLMIPKMFESKDYTDLIKNMTKHTAEAVITNLINTKLTNEHKESNYINN